LLLPELKQKRIEVITTTPKETQNFGYRLGQKARAGDVFLLIGPLGAGKTILVNGLAGGLGAQEWAMSPSFVLIRELAGRVKLFHVDLYRLGKLDEIAELGLDDLIFSEGVTAVEWADRAIEMMPLEYMLIQLEYHGENQRKLIFTSQGKRYNQLMRELGRREKAQWI
jgi:tRNA threonylcarbamoyladenosine biosynthesis protein TsaE